MASSRSLGVLTLDLVAQIGGFQEGLSKAARATKKTVEEIQRNIEGVTRIIEGGLAAIGLDASVSAFLELGKSAIEAGDQLERAAKTAGVSGEAISQLSYVAKLADVGVDDLSKSLVAMERNLSLAASGGAQQTKALQALGLTYRDLKGLSPDKQFELIGEQISKLKDPSDRARAALDLFNKSGLNLLPIFADGAAGIEKARQEAIKFGSSFSDEQLKRLADANETIKNMQTSFESLALTLTSHVAPALERGFKTITGVFSNNSLDKIGGQLAALQGADSIYGPLPGPMSQATGIPFERKLLSPSTWFGLYETHATRQSQIQGLQSILEAMQSSQSFAGTDFDLGAGAKSAAPGYNPALDLKKLLSDPYFKDIDAATKNFNIAGSILGIDPQQLEDTRATFDKFFADINGDSDETMKKLGKAIDDAMRHLSDGAEAFDYSFKSAFDDFLQTGTFSARNLALTFVEELSRKEIIKAIDNISKALDEAFQPAGKSGSIWSTLLGGVENIFAGLNFNGTLSGSYFKDIDGGATAILAGARAAGGPVSAGQAYLVGENGPEIFRAPTSGTIIPNNKLFPVTQGGATKMGGGINVGYTFNGTGLSQDQILQLMKKNNADLSRNIREMNRRGEFQRRG